MSRETQLEAAFHELTKKTLEAKKPTRCGA